MKLHFDPISTTSRPILLFAGEAGVKLEPMVVSLMEGKHHAEPFVGLNPNRLVPVLEDGDFILTESSAILKYPADKVGSPLYPKELRSCVRHDAAADVCTVSLEGFELRTAS